MNEEVKLILTKLKIISEEKEQYLYLSDKEHNKILLDYITNLQEENISLREQIRTYYRPENELNKHKYEILQERVNKAYNKIENMFDRGEEETLIDDLLELQKILKGEIDD